MAYRKKTNTKLSVDQILDGAADILEAHGVVNGTCHDSVTGGHCALGAIARAIYPKATTRELGELAFVDNGFYRPAREPDPAHVEAVHFLAGRLSEVLTYPSDPPQVAVFAFNDDAEYATQTFEQEDAGLAPFLTVKSSKKVVAKFRSAAKAYRKQQEKKAA